MDLITPGLVQLPVSSYGQPSASWKLSSLISPLIVPCKQDYCLGVAGDHSNACKIIRTKAYFLALAQ